RPFTLAWLICKCGGSSMFCRVFLLLIRRRNVFWLLSRPIGDPSGHFIPRTLCHRPIIGVRLCSKHAHMCVYLVFHLGICCCMPPFTHDWQLYKGISFPNHCVKICKARSDNLHL